MTNLILVQERLLELQEERRKIDEEWDRLMAVKEELLEWEELALKLF